jgi:hypothetical protein
MITDEEYMKLHSELLQLRRQYVESEFGENRTVTQ